MQPEVLARDFLPSQMGSVPFQNIPDSPLLKIFLGLWHGLDCFSGELRFVVEAWSFAAGEAELHEPFMLDVDVTAAKLVAGFHALG